ncbi:MAG: ABC transporter permease, partial [Desulfovibrionaceae bacterium]|nr:ABC transporter permease [Desulfovibrionaceae bacterium]
QDMVLMGGVNVINVTMEDRQFPGQPVREFYPESVDGIASLPGVELVSRNLRNGRFFNLKAGERTLGTFMYGVDALFISCFSADLVAGEPLSQADIDRHRRVCMVGRDLAIDLFGSPQAAVGQLLFLDQDVLEIKGVIAGVMLGDWAKGGFVPYTTMCDRKWGDAKVTRLFVRAVGWEDIARLATQIPEVVQSCQDAPYVKVNTRDDQISRLQVTFMWVETLLWLGIVASLMLGGFGIWYGTFAAVRARTREVGLKKAMGGSDRDIMAQFLCEALCKSVAGGMLGILLGLTAVFCGVWALGTNIPLLLLCASCLGSIIFSAAIGIAGGIYPALQASRMDVVTALRFE